MVKVFIDYDNSGSFETGELAAASAAALSNGSVFVANISIPANATIGNLYRMRVIAQETANAGDVAACGTYGKGETQDFSIRVVNPSNDMVMTEIVSPQSLYCGTDSMYVAVSIRNNGATEQSNIPLSVSIGSSAGVVANLTAVYPGTLPGFTSTVYTFQKPITLAAGTAYTFTATVSLSNDQLTSNNQIVTPITTAAKPAAPDPVASVCSNVVNLRVNNPGLSNYFWYTSATGNQPFAEGSPATSPTGPSTFYVAKEVRGVVGLANKMIYPNGGYNHFNGNFMRISNNVPFIIESARLYVGNAGKVEFTVGTNLVENANGTYSFNAVSRVVLDLYATKPNPGPNPSTATTVENPATDTGAVFHLGLPMPVTGDDNLIAIRLLYPDGTRIPQEVAMTGASLFRNNEIPGNIYPIGINQAVRFTGNSATGQGVQQSQFYYLFYDMKVNTGDCVSDRVAVVPVTTPTPVISLQADSLVSTITSGNQWYVNDTLIAGATGTKYKPTRGGIYKTVVTDQFGCQKISNTINYVLTAIDPTVTAREINLKVSPNPNNGVFNLSFEVTSRADLSIALYNESGQRIYYNAQSNFSGKYSRAISLPHTAAGLYLLKVQHDKKNYVVKVVVQR